MRLALDKIQFRRQSHQSTSTSAPAPFTRQHHQKVTHSPEIYHRLRIPIDNARLLCYVDSDRPTERPRISPGRASPGRAPSGACGPMGPWVFENRIFSSACRHQEAFDGLGLSRTASAPRSGFRRPICRIANRLYSKANKAVIGDFAREGKTRTENLHPSNIPRLTEAGSRENPPLNLGLSMPLGGGTHPLAGFVGHFKYSQPSPGRGGRATRKANAPSDESPRDAAQGSRNNNRPRGSPPLSFRCLSAAPPTEGSLSIRLFQNHARYSQACVQDAS